MFSLPVFDVSGVMHEVLHALYDTHNAQDCYVGTKPFAFCGARKAFSRWYFEVLKAAKIKKKIS